MVTWMFVYFILWDKWCQILYRMIGYNFVQEHQKNGVQWQLDLDMDLFF